MTETVGPEAGGSAPVPTVEAAPARSDRQALRRQLLLGGIATTGMLVTLANRPALAWNKGGDANNNCTLSALGSVNPSHPTAGPCGDSPGCWKNKNCDVWSPSSYFKNQPVLYNWNTPLSSVCPNLRNGVFTVSGPDKLLNYLTSGYQGCAATTITVDLSGCGRKKSNTLTLWSYGQSCNVVAAILNDYFYGTLYHPSSCINYVNSVLGNIITYATNGTCDSNDIINAVSTCDGYLTSWNQQGEICSL